MGAMINSYGLSVKHDIDRQTFYLELLRAFKRDYEDGTITAKEYVAFLKTQMAKIKAGN